MTVLNMSINMDVRLKQRAVIEFLTAEGVAPIDIHRRLSAVYHDACVDVSTVRRWVRTVKVANPAETDIHDRARSGRPVSACGERQVALVDELVRENRRCKQNDIANRVGISQERVHHIICNVLQYRRVCARWVPRMLTDEMKANRKQICEQLLTRYEAEGDAFLHRIVTGDESWAHHYDPEMKRQSMEYRHKGSPQPKKFKALPSAGKVMITVFWDCDGIVHIEFLERGCTVNSEGYVNTLTNLRRRLRRIRPDKVPILHHDNARPHTSQRTRVALEDLGFHDVLPHPPYSPDLAPCDFFLFPKLKEYLKGKRFSSDAEVITEVRKWCRGKSSDFFRDGLAKLVLRWRKCIAVNGDYVEK